VFKFRSRQKRSAIQSWAQCQQNNPLQGILTDMDDYRIEYIYVPGSDISKMKTVLVQEGVTVETLQSSFTEATGLYTRLF